MADPDAPPPSRRRALAIAIPVLVLIAAVSMWGAATTADDSPGAGAGGLIGSPSYEAFRAQPTACGATTPPPARRMTFEAPGDPASDRHSVTLHTSCGPVMIALAPAEHPETVRSFLFLAGSSYFDGTACHRLVAEFVLQCGDPTATGRGDPGYAVDDEFPRPGFTYAEGVVAMANAGPGSTGSQFFVVLGDGASQLPAEYSILGHVHGSEDTLAEVSHVPVGPAPTGEHSHPLESVYIESITIG